MKNTIKKDFPFIFLGVILVAFLFSFLLDNPLMQLREFFVEQYFYFSSIAYFLAITVSTIFSPITVAPAIPFVSKVLGSGETFVSTFLGILTGSSISFFLARKIGRDFILKFFSEDKLEFLEEKLPKNLRFTNILFFRLFTPPDGFSYFLGIHSKIKFWKYFAATAFGILPITFILSFGADAITGGNKILFFFLIFAVLIIIFSKAFYTFLNSKKAKLITHPHNFHVDDIFAAAALALFMEKRGIAYEIIRTRDTGDLEKYKKEARKQDEQKPVFVFDVGGEYDEENNLFDHHQREGAGVRENGISYSSFGLVWKKYGEKLCGSVEIAEKIDYQIVMGIDANDTGVNLSKPLYEFSLYGFPSLKNSFAPISGKKEDFDIAFEKVVKIAKDVLKNEIAWARKKIDDAQKFEKFYNKSPDKRVVWINDTTISIGKYFPNHPEILFLVKKKVPDDWIIIATLKNNKTKAVKIKMPKEWGGLEGAEFEKVSGINGVKFCHRGRWIAAANSKEAAEQMIEKILENIE